MTLRHHKGNPCRFELRILDETGEPVVIAEGIPRSWQTEMPAMPVYELGSLQVAEIIPRNIEISFKGTIVDPDKLKKTELVKVPLDVDEARPMTQTPTEPEEYEYDFDDYDDDE